jgi:beta-mannanase
MTTIQLSKLENMKSKAFRLTLTILAFSLAIVIVVLLTFAGDKTRGPLSDLFVYSGEVVQKAEKKVLLEVREEKRSDKLLWFQGLKATKAGLQNPSKMLLGAFDNNTAEGFESIVALEDSIKTTFPIVHVYAAWGDKTEQEFPATQVASILEMGSVPLITWEPWLTDFDREKHPGLKVITKRDGHGMRDVADGSYDFYLASWAEECKKAGGQIFIRFGHEMNDPYRYPWGPQNNSAKEFIAAWKHVHSIFNSKGATNVIWVWSPHPAYGWFDAYYPGDKYVDYVGVGTLNYGTVASWSQWWTFDEIFGKYYGFMAKYKKPIMLTEFGSLGVGGKRDKWFADALHDLPARFPQVKSLIFFHYSDDRTTTRQALNWYVKDDRACTAAIKKELAAWPASPVQK